MSAKNLDKHDRFRCITVGFRVSPEEHETINRIVALSGLTKLVLGWLPAGIGDIPLLQIGIPALLSIYFDVFSGCLQAFIFAMLTMMYISGGFPEEDYLKRKAKKLAKKNKKTN